MSKYKLEEIAISIKSHRLLKILLQENPKLEEILHNAHSLDEVHDCIRNWVMNYLKSKRAAYKYYKNEANGQKAYKKLDWKDFAAIRILDYIDHSGEKFEDLNLRGITIKSMPFKQLWFAVKRGTGGGKPQFFEDMIQLFRQFTGKSTRQLPSKEAVIEWMERHPSGLDPDIVKIREENRNRIVNVLIKKMDSGEINDPKYHFRQGMTQREKYEQVQEWWADRIFHLKFAIRSPKDLNEYLGYSLDPETMRRLYNAEKAGIPFFVNPYYLSLFNVQAPYFAIGADLAIRQYIIYSKQLIKEFGDIVAWEREDIVQPGEPNAAGWLLPEQHNVHRRYPEVAILIPDTVGRACGGLCTSCQRMYDFQSGHLNFNLDTLRPQETWSEKLKRLMTYFETDSQLRDILITGGDALMSSDHSLKKILDEVYQMAVRKKKANLNRSEKYAEMVRVRLGTRLPVYLPQRITPELVKILRDFKEKASQTGIKQFVIQTHFITAMEVTPEARRAVKMLTSAGWMVVNQLVFTSGASRRGHTAKMRQVLNDIGVLPYYTFSVKGYMENYHNFAPNARSVQEQIEEKAIGEVPQKYYETIKNFPQDAEHIAENIEQLQKSCELPFLATDRNVLNLPGVGKSMTYRVIGITRHGRRILEFDHDATRVHSPIINKMGKVAIIESKSIHEYLQQLEEMGENPQEYLDVYGYSIGETEVRMPVYEYPEYEFETTPHMTNLEIEEPVVEHEIIRQ